MLLILEEEEEEFSSWSKGQHTRCLEGTQFQRLLLETCSLTARADPGGFRTRFARMTP